MTDLKCFLVLLPFFNLVYSKEVIVDTSLGRIAGIEVNSILQNEKYYSFMGIPYAEPPLGKLRFMAPRPHAGWNDVLQAKKERKHCAIMNLPIGTGNYGFCGDEDCLHLSIYTPKLSAENEDVAASAMPVMVFIYNEHYRILHNASKEFGPDFLVNEDVIVVSVSYRIGSPGFLSFGDDLLPGNNGIRDIILALKWIQKDIQNFGGDSSRVTLMGVGSGAGLVDILLHSPKATGLYHNVILQSGTSWSSDYFGGVARDRAIRFSKQLDIETKTSSFLLKRLDDISSSELVLADHLALHADEARAVQTSLHSFGPVIEHDHPDAILTKDPLDQTFNINVPVMIGYNSKESLRICERYLRKPQYLTFADRDFLIIIPIRMKFHFKIHSQQYYKAIQEIKEKYFDEAYVKTKQPGELFVYVGDVFTIYPIDYTVRKYVNASSSPVYYYTFDYNGDFNIRKKELLKEAMSADGTVGASFGDDICYLFVCNLERKAYKTALQENSEEIQIVRNMVKMWTNFAKTGNPSIEDFEWKPASKEDKDILVIGDKLQMKTRLHDDRIQFWDEFLAKYKELAVEGVVGDVKDEL